MNVRRRRGYLDGRRCVALLCIRDKCHPRQLKAVAGGLMLQAFFVAALGFICWCASASHERGTFCGLSCAEYLSFLAQLKLVERSPWCTSWGGFFDAGEKGETEILLSALCKLPNFLFWGWSGKYCSAGVFCCLEGVMVYGG